MRNGLIHRSDVFGYASAKVDMVRSAMSTSGLLPRKNENSCEWLMFRIIVLRM